MRVFRLVLVQWRVLEFTADEHNHFLSERVLPERQYLRAVELHNLRHWPDLDRDDLRELDPAPGVVNFLLNRLLLGRECVPDQSNSSAPTSSSATASTTRISASSTTIGSAAAGAASWRNRGISQ